VLASRSRSSTIVWSPTLIAIVMVIRREGAYGVVVHFESLASLSGALTLAIHAGRKWRGVKPPEHKPRRNKELDRLALTRSRVTTLSPAIR
jgi:hypothetical protein